MTIRNIQGTVRAREALPVTLNDGKRDTIYPLVLSEFYVEGLEQIQFVSWRQDYVQVDYVAEQNIDEAVRKEFHQILEMRGAQRTTFEVRRVRSIDVDPGIGKLKRVRIVEG